MRVVGDFPHRVREVENVWIPMPDGCRLAARVWLPECAPQDPVPAILEAIPYRKRDGTRERDETMHRWFAGHGYAAVRVDVRGTGTSDGTLRDEYTEEERADGVATIHWIAQQPWCTGAVGMIGKSWGGIAALQIAALRPPELTAVISVCSTDDRYRTDAHWMGGCLLNENLAWGSMLLTLAALPPDPAIRGATWRATWADRLSQLEPFPANWMRHPQRDAYWKSGSVCEELDRIACPVYLVGGWADAYTDTVPRMLAGLQVARRGLVGPWAHVYPHEGVPGPAIGFLQECKRWWDQWLRGIDTGILDEPMYRVWMADAPPGRDDQVAGRWVAESSWPSPRIVPRTWSLGTFASRGNLQGHTSSLATGLAAGPWCAFGFEADPAPDQQPDDARSLVFDSEPLAERVEILGAPEVRLALAVDRPRACIAVRLCDVAPNGSSHRVAYALANLGQRNGATKSSPSAAGASVTLELGHAAYAFQPGHRLRLAISTSYWPIAWPMPEPVVLRLDAASSSLALPVRPVREADAALRPFDPPEGAPRGASEDLEPGGVQERLEHSADGEILCTQWIDCDATGNPTTTRYPAIDLEVGHGIVERFRIVEGDPLSARTEIEHRAVRRRGAWSVRVETRCRLEATPPSYRFGASVEAYEGDERVFDRIWQLEIPRDPSSEEVEE